MHVPIARQGSGRIDNPDLYGCLYLSDSPAGAVAEAFGWFGIWHRDMFEGPGALPGSTLALAHYVLGRGPILDLDNSAELVKRRLRPSRVVATDRSITQGWARAVFGERRWTGVSWWSHWDARWSTVGLWRTRSLRARPDVQLLDRHHGAVREAGEVLGRDWRDEL